jgi:hypothetical protein
MTDSVVDALIVDLLDWLAVRDRTYDEVIEVWRTSCPKLPVWEDAGSRGFVALENCNGREIVRITPAGISFLQQRKTSAKNTQRTGNFRPA